MINLLVKTADIENFKTILKDSLRSVGLPGSIDLLISQDLVKDYLSVYLPLNNTLCTDLVKLIGEKLQTRIIAYTEDVNKVFLTFTSNGVTEVAYTISDPELYERYLTVTFTGNLSLLMNYGFNLTTTELTKQVEDLVVKANKSLIYSSANLIELFTLLNILELKGMFTWSADKLLLTLKQTKDFSDFYANNEFPTLLKVTL